MASDPISLITLNRYPSRGFFPDGVQGKRIDFNTHTHISTPPSCLTHPDSLDTPCCHRSATHTDVLLELHDDEALRKSYGIASGATVCIKYVLNLTRTNLY